MLRPLLVGTCLAVALTGCVSTPHSRTTKAVNTALTGACLAVQLYPCTIESSEDSKATLPEPVKNLRTNPLKRYRELRAAALFCYGMGQRLGQTVHVGDSEAQEYDFVASRVVDGTRHPAPVQLKEVVSRNLNASTDIQTTIRKTFTLYNPLGGMHSCYLTGGFGS
jgi:hypothetical protein